MDYKYIEQLLERYWECETTVEEERLLHDFFQQENLPEHLKRFRPLFEYETSEQNVGLGEDFDEKILSKIDEPVVKARHNTLRYRLRPFYRAAAVVAIVFTLGLAAQHSFKNDGGDQSEPNYNYATYKDTYTDPQVAYEHVSSALKSVSDGLRASGMQESDSLNVSTDNNEEQ